MTRIPFLATAALAALIVAAPPATAQGRNRSGQGHPQRAQRAEGGGGQQRGGERQAVPRDGGNVQQQPREERGVAGQARNASPRQDAHAQDNGRQDVTPQPQPQPGQPQRYAQRWPDGTRPNGGNRNDNRVDGRYAVPRPVAPLYNNHVYVQPRPNYYVYRYPAYRYYTPYPYYGYSYYDPYYRGDFFWGFGTHSWVSSGYYGAGYGTGYQYNLGKLRLQVQPREAQVYIDGYYAGTVDDFDGRLQGLQLEAGNYHVEVTLPGFAPLQFDAQVTPGRTTTYRGDLLPDPSNQPPPPGAPF
jgi:hypothetical protein